MKTLLTITTPPTKTKARRIPIEPGVKDAVFSPELKALLEGSIDNRNPQPHGRPSPATDDVTPYNLD